MLNFDGETDVEANADVKCEQSITQTVQPKKIKTFKLKSQSN